MKCCPNCGSPDIKKVKLRCYVEKTEAEWVASCLDLCLAAQADSMEEAKNKLHQMITLYLEEAFGEDKEYIDQLIPRRAPASEWIKYYFFSIRFSINKLIKSKKEAFEPFKLLESVHSR